MKISIRTSDVTEFEGDTIIIPCDTELTYTKSLSPNSEYPLFKVESRKSLTKSLFEKGGKDLVKELTAIGYCEMGYAVAINGYELKARTIIYMPITDHKNEIYGVNYIDLHQSLKAAFTLADLYKAKTVAIAGIHMPTKRQSFFKTLWNKFVNDEREVDPLSSGQIEDIVISTSKNFENSSIKELIIYKYSK